MASIATVDGSNFSDNALTTLESLVLECQLENIRQDEAKRRGSLGSKGSATSGTARTHKQRTSKIKHTEMPAEDRAFIATLPGNSKCADCGCSDTEWASITYGILICTECSGVHRALGTHLSRVRSVLMDSWEDKHIKAMRHGGNKKCRDYLRKHGLKLKECSIRERYESHVAKRYHSKLKAAIKVVTSTEAHPLQGRCIKRSSAPVDPLLGTIADEDVPVQRMSAPDPLLGTLNNDNDNVDVPPVQTITAPVADANAPLPPPSSAPPRIMAPPAATTRRFQRYSITSPAAMQSRPPTRSLSASAPTIVYMGRSFQANDPTGANNTNSDETLRIDDWDVQRKLEHWWFHRNGEENDEHQSYSNASSSLSSNSLSLSSYFGGGGGSAVVTNKCSGAALTAADLHALQTDPEVKDYVRQQLLQRWDEKGQRRR